MSVDAPPAPNQLEALRLLIYETQHPGTRFDSEHVTFAEAFRQTCGHNRLEQIGIRWTDVLTPAQTHVLATDSRVAGDFACHLYRALMRHLLPPEPEMASLSKAAVLQWTAALRMGIQGVLRRRACVSGDTPEYARFATPSETFLRALRPVIHRAAAEFFPAPLVH